ncbi:MAG: hypothetical protein P8103_02350 [Candidatus Thiodiazotropha sp.]
MRSKQIEECIEILCQKGCHSVRQDIRLLERGESLPELRVLDDLARQTVLKELRAIMAVYGDSCPVADVQENKKQEINHGKNN